MGLRVGRNRKKILLVAMYEKRERRSKRSKRGSGGIKRENTLIYIFFFSSGAAASAGDAFIRSRGRRMVGFRRGEPWGEEGEPAPHTSAPWRGLRLIGPASILMKFC